MNQKLLSNIKLNVNKFKPRFLRVHVLHSSIIRFLVSYFKSTQATQIKSKDLNNVKQTYILLNSVAVKQSKCIARIDSLSVLVNTGSKVKRQCLYETVLKKSCQRVVYMAWRKKNQKTSKANTGVVNTKKEKRMLWGSWPLWKHSCRNPLRHNYFPSFFVLDKG